MAFQEDLDAHVRAARAARVQLQITGILSGILALLITVIGVIWAWLSVADKHPPGPAGWAVAGVLAVGVAAATNQIVEIVRLVNDRRRIRGGRGAHGEKIIVKVSGLEFRDIRDEQVLSMLSRISSEQMEFSEAMAKEVRQ